MTRFDSAGLESQNGLVDDPLYLPITDQQEVQTLFDELPLAGDPDDFIQFVLGFPRHYLVKTPRVDIVKHFLLAKSRGDQPFASSLYRHEEAWKLCLVTQDRDQLFCRIAGTLSCTGMDIRSAEAFANANAVVLDTFEFTDPSSVFASSRRQQDFQHLLEKVLAGQQQLEELFESRAAQVCILDDRPPRIRMDNNQHPDATYLSIDFPDHFGHLYLTSRCISEQGGSIEMAYVHISGPRIHDEYYLTCNGQKLALPQQEKLHQALAQVMRPYLKQQAVGL